jgi:hypothetical protein
MPTPISDQRALDEIANILCEPEWDIGALEWIADVVGFTERPHPGGYETRDDYVRDFEAATGRVGLIDGDDENDVTIGGPR